MVIMPFSPLMMLAIKPPICIWATFLERPPPLRRSTLSITKAGQTSLSRSRLVATPPLSPQSRPPASSSSLAWRVLLSSASAPKQPKPQGNKKPRSFECGFFLHFTALLRHTPHHEARQFRRAFCFELLSAITLSRSTRSTRFSPSTSMTSMVRLLPFRRRFRIAKA